jgi:hypothetical protein
MAIVSRVSAGGTSDVVEFGFVAQSLGRIDGWKMGNGWRSQRESSIENLYLSGP